MEEVREISRSKQSVVGRRRCVEVGQWGCGDDKAAELGRVVGAGDGEGRLLGGGWPAAEEDDDKAAELGPRRGGGRSGAVSLGLVATGPVGVYGSQRELYGHKVETGQFGSPQRRPFNFYHPTSPLSQRHHTLRTRLSSH